MKKALCCGSIVILNLILISWVSVGHRTIGKIAENHLTLKSKQAIHELLRGASLADVSTYADELRLDKDYYYTAPWHFIDVPAGLSHNQFKEYVIHLSTPNIYINFLINLDYLSHPEHIKGNPSQIKAVQANSLKWLIHEVGDMHQPFHVSRSEDKGGNTIQVRFNGKRTNLHSLWDSKLIDHQNLSYEELAKQYDNATIQQIKEWQSDSPIEWLWESYQLSSKLYQEVAPGNKLDEKYYNDHIPIIKTRIEQAGIRLAGVLNQTSVNVILPMESVMTVGEDNLQSISVRL